VALRPSDRGRGLRAINDARQTRRRAIVLGRVSVREAAPRFWIFTFIGIVVFSAGYYRYTLGVLAARKNEVKAQQRAVQVTVGDAGFALRDRLERWITDLARAAEPNRIASELELEMVARGPGIYARLGLAAARDSGCWRK